MSRKLWDTPPATVSEAARLFAHLSFDILPVKAGEKVPSAKAWTTATFTPDDIAPEGNLGLRLAPPLVDIDLDCQAAAVLAEALMPTTLVSGRPGAPRTHLWYSVDTPVTQKVYADEAATARTVLLEIRAGSTQYTLCPPSLHPSGERLTWSGDTLTSLDPETLQKRVALVAALTLLSLHWPAQGQRHAAFGALTGLLLAYRIPPDLIRPGIRALCQVTRDDETEDRLRHVESTLARWETDAPTSGATTLKGLIGDVVTKATAWLAETWGRVPVLKPGDPRLEALNAIHFVTQLGQDLVVGEEEEDRVSFYTFANFDKKYCNAPKIGTQRLSKVWLESEGRRSYRRVGFAPPGAPPLPHSHYNLWRGYACSPDPRPEPERRIARFLEHATEVVANGDATVATYVLDLLAANVQRPGDPSGKVLVLRSDQGLGKSVFFESFGRLFGRHFMAISSYRQLVGDFNAHLSGKVAILADDAIWGGNKESVGVLKQLITQRSIPIQRKNIDIEPEPNYISLYAATNEVWAWPAGPHERRGVILDVVRKSSEAYFARLWEETRSRDFLPALLAFFLARAVDTARVRRGLRTQALEEQQLLTADPVQSWWHDVLDEGTWIGDGAKIPEGTSWPVFLAHAAAYDAFTTSIKATHRHTDTRAVFLRRWSKLLPPVERAKQRVSINVARAGAPHYESVAAWGAWLPSLAACRAAYRVATGATRAWSEASVGLLDVEEGIV